MLQEWRKNPNQVPEKGFQLCHEFIQRKSFQHISNIPAQNITHPHQKPTKTALKKKESTKLTPENY